jgi:alkylation response protein AidB-like acyl-CoA dehydrogenase
MFSMKEASALAREADVRASVDAVDRYLAAHAGASAFRNARGRAVPAEEQARFRGLVGLGLTSFFMTDTAGGCGLGDGTVPLFADRLGWWLAREPFVENVVLPGALARRAGDGETGAAIADGVPVCVAWQEDKFDRPGRVRIATLVNREGAGWRLKGAKRFVMGAAASERILVQASIGAEPALVCVPAALSGVARTDKLLADGTHWSDLTFDVALPDNAVRARGPHVEEAFVQAVALGNLAIAGVLHGLQSRILAMTLDYLRTRVQFGRPIGAFQALQHRAADLYTHAQITRFLLGTAADALRDGAPGNTLEIYASRTKSRAADAAVRIAKEGIQMHGAIGFSDDYDLGLYVKRVLVLSAWLGGADWHRRHLASLDPIEVEAVA